MPNPPVHPLVVHFADGRKLHGVACNHERRRRPLQMTTDRVLVTCRYCLGVSLIDGSDD